MMRLATVIACLCSAFSLNAWAGSFPVGGFRVEMQGIKEIREHQLVRQQADFTCGSAALATILNYQYGDDVTEKHIIQTILKLGKPLSVARREGFSLLDLKRYAVIRGFNASGYLDTKTSQLMRFNTPALVPVDLKGYRHFVVVRDVADGQVFIANPALGNMRMRVEDFEAIWQGGIAFYILPKNSVSEKNLFAARSQDYAFVTPERTPAWRALREPVTLRHPPSDYILREPVGQ